MYYDTAGGKWTVSPIAHFEARSGSRRWILKRVHVRLHDDADTRGRVLAAVPRNC
jgi:hypothetical protein